MQQGTVTGWLGRVFGSPDGAAPPAPGTASGGVAAEEGAGRRDRGFGQPRELIDDALAQKVLHGWLQNRHQVLVPLTFSFARLAPAQVETLAAMAAAALFNGTDGGEAARRDAERWLTALGATPTAIEGFRQAVQQPAPLHAVLAGVRARGLEPFAYAAAVAIGDTRSPAARLFAAYVAARLDLPADAIRSIDRRYGR